MLTKNWLVYASVTTIFWGTWGAFIEIPEKAGFPATLGYSVWALTMIPCSLVALYLIDWKLEHDGRSILLGSLVIVVLLIPVAMLMTDFSVVINTGFEGPYLAGIIHVMNSIGALALVYALRYGKAMVVDPVTGLSPLITVVLSLFLYGIVPDSILTAGVVLAMIGIHLLSD